MYRIFSLTGYLDRLYS